MVARTCAADTAWVTTRVPAAECVAWDEALPLGANMNAPSRATADAPTTAVNHRVFINISPRFLAYAEQLVSTILAKHTLGQLLASTLLARFLPAHSCWISAGARQNIR